MHQGFNYELKQGQLLHNIYNTLQWSFRAAKTDEITSKSLNICKPSSAQDGSYFTRVTLTSLYISFFFSSRLATDPTGLTVIGGHMLDIKPSRLIQAHSPFIWLMQAGSECSTNM